MLLFERTTHGDELAPTGQLPLAMRRQSVPTVYVCGPVISSYGLRVSHTKGVPREPDAFPPSPPRPPYG
jgi:hypothetical protein